MNESAYKGPRDPINAPCNQDELHAVALQVLERHHQQELEKLRGIVQTHAEAYGKACERLAAEREQFKAALTKVDSALAAEREKRGIIERSRDAWKALAQREKPECTCDIDTICRVHGCPKCYEWQKQLAAEQKWKWEQAEKVKTLVEATRHAALALAGVYPAPAALQECQEALAKEGK